MSYNATSKGQPFNFFTTIWCNPLLATRFMHLWLGSINMHYGGIFAYNGQGIFENPRSRVPISSIFTCIQDFESMGVIYGLALQHIRKICMNELFTFKNIQSFQPMRTKEIQEIIKDISRKTNEGKVVNLTFKLSSISTNNMTQMLFKKK